MGWRETMTSAHAALARAERALEDEDPARTREETWIATTRAMLAWLRAYHPDDPAAQCYGATLGRFADAATTGPRRGVLSVHLRLTTPDRVQEATGYWWPAPLAGPDTDQEPAAVIEATNGAIRSLEQEIEGRPR